MKTLAQLLVEYCEKNDYDISIESMREVILECLPQKWQGNAEEYRWRVEESRVFEILDGPVPRYFMHNICTYSGENGWEDAGFTWQSFDEMEEVESKEVRTIKWVAK